MGGYTFSAGSVQTLPKPQKFKKVRTKADIRNDPRVKEMWHEEDSGWFAALRCGDDPQNGVSWMYCIHGVFCSCLIEDTIAALCEQLNEQVELYSCPIEGGE